MIDVFQHYLAVLTLVLIVGMALARAQLLKRQGVEALHFGKIDKKDFLIPPFALFYFYLVFAAAFGWPSVSTQEFFRSRLIAWGGVAFCLAGLALFLWSLISFGRSFRVGIDQAHPDKLITTGSFAISRNPIYVALLSIFAGQFLIFSNVILLIYVVAAGWLIHRQVLREEDFLNQHYGEEFTEYCRRVRRYI